MLKVKNWSSYQSYKDRRPPWIRFQKSILDDYDYQSMSADARALLPMLWLLASEDEDPVSGLIRSSYETITFRLRMDKKLFVKTLEEIVDKGFIIDLQAIEKQACNETVTEPYIKRNETVTPETETEAYSKETEKSNKEGVARIKKFDLESPPLFWIDFAKDEKGWSEDIAVDVFLSFKEYWTLGKGKNQKREDWYLSWKTWVRKETIKPKQINGGGHARIDKIGEALQRGLDRIERSTKEASQSFS